ncbi:MAG TPA: hypothetical protein VNH44_05935 [Micropepsaceae bacterium]|nr:hypothetical protein [Micropepsaceae bacterium]
MKYSLRIALCAFLLGAPGFAWANYYDDPHEIDVTGPYTQAATGMVFPESVRDFQRDEVISYNSERTDESATYIREKDGSIIAISVYVYPVPADLGSALAQSLPKEDLVGAWYMLGEQLFNEEEEGVVELHPGAELVDGGETSFDQHGVSYPGAFSTYRYDEDFFGSVQPVRSQLHVFPMVGGKWMVKYRITYPEGVDGAAQATAFIHALPWTIRGLK